MTLRHVHRDEPLPESTAALVARLEAAHPGLDKSLTAFLQRQLGSRADIRDAVQETYARILHTAGPIRDLEGYAITVAKSVAIDIARRRGEERARYQPLEENDSPMDGSLHETRSLEQDYDLHQLMQTADAKFQRLPESAKHAFAAHVWGETIESIAQRMGVHVRTVHRYIGRVRAECAELLKHLRGDRDNE